ncbi:glycoside hydrolase family 16 protein [Priestia megaterium]|uniref:GH16 domain-containing protein n=1 Tax=Priestia megaterium TaxID=1404 RepID=A0A6M6E960_PRIMG|nr:glycoside hydrolase family 16 protein [Priestia megaterium]QJX80968.1 hypothetical protein FDZ14_33295 [Priestia megaterium]
MKVKYFGLICGVILSGVFLSNHKVNADTDERTINFSGYEWTVRNSLSLQGPGPNYFSGNDDSVWVDDAGRLHMKIKNIDGKWYGSEIRNKQALGYGEYRFYMSSKVDVLDKNVVLGLFTYDHNSNDAEANEYREIDIEFSKWGEDESENSQYSLQSTYQRPDRFKMFNSYLEDGDYTTQSFNWTPNSINFESLYGHYKVPPADYFRYNSFTYTGDGIPKPGLATTHINLWLLKGMAPSNNKEVEVVIKGFEFTPYTPTEIIPPSEEPEVEVPPAETQLPEEEPEDTEPPSTENPQPEEPKEPKTPTVPITKLFKVVTGTFIGESNVQKAQKDLFDKLGVSANINYTFKSIPVYNIVTGEFIGKNNVDRAIKDLRSKIGWNAKSAPTGNFVSVYRLSTGTIKGKANAEKVLKVFKSKTGLYVVTEKVSGNTYKLVTSGYIMGEEKAKGQLNVYGKIAKKNNWVVRAEKTKDSLPKYRIIISGFYGDEKVNTYKQDFQQKLKWDMHTQKIEDVNLYALSVKNIENEDAANTLINQMKGQLHWSASKQEQN